jgi:hypothetical protein
MISKQIKKLIFALAVAAGIAFIWLGLGFYLHYREVMLLSGVKAPVRFALQEIGEDMATQHYDIAGSKLDILNRCWENFYSGEGDNTYHGFADIIHSFHQVHSDHAATEKRYIVPLLSGEFGRFIRVKGAIRILPRGKYKSREFDDDLMIEINTVDDSPIAPVMMKLFSYDKTKMTRWRALPAGTAVDFSGYESIGTIGFPNDPLDSHTVQHQAFGIYHLFVVMRTNRMLKGGRLEIEELHGGELFRVNGRNCSVEDVKSAISSLKPVRIKLIRDKADSAAGDANVKKIREFCRERRIGIDVVIPTSLAADDAPSAR